jgi:hypothetical protein
MARDRHPITSIRNLDPEADMVAFNRQLRELTEFDSRGAGVLSLYLVTDPRLVDDVGLDTEVNRVAEALKSGLEPEQRAALEEELMTVRDYLGSMLAPPTAVALFTCTPRHFFRVVRLPAPVTPAAYWAQWAHLSGLAAAHAQQADEEQVLSVSP